MPIRLDHVITAGHSLASLEATFQTLGFVASGGGIHPHLGTRNRIIVLGESYLELLAVADAEHVSPVLARRLAAGPGWIGCALQSAAIDAEVAAMRSHGVDVRGPVRGRLVAPDGSARSWQVATVGSEDLWAGAEPLPFLIQHDTHGEQHQRELGGAQASAPQPNGARALRAITIAVADLAVALAAFATTYGLQPSAPPRADATLGAEVVSLALPDGAQITLARPGAPGLAQRRLAAAGEGLCRVSIAVADLAATLAFLRAAGLPIESMDDAVLVPPAAAAGAALRFIAE